VSVGDLENPPLLYYNTLSLLLDIRNIGDEGAHLDPPLDKALDGTFGGQGVLLHYDFLVFDEGVGLHEDFPWLSLAEYQFSQFSGPAIRRSRELV